jgi:DNA-binding XRE family transcriptional regulator
MGRHRPEFGEGVRSVGKRQTVGETGIEHDGCCLLNAAGIVPAGSFGEQMMKATKRTRLERAGWRVGTAAQFLGLTPEEQLFVELKLALAGGVRQLRERQGLTQGELAKRLGSSQSRIAKMEAADVSVSLDLLMRSLLSIGATASDIAKLIKRAEAGRAA